MPTSLTVDEHIAVLDRAGTGLLEAATAAGPDAPVPTCPRWRTTALLAHIAMVHRWATAHVRGDDPEAVPNQTTISAGVADLPGYVAEGLEALLAALRDAPDDLAATVFLQDAPPPRAFWARRQAHETTIHMVDALGATLGRPPSTDEAGIDPSAAVDGLDELLRGFFTRGRSKLHDGEDHTVTVVPDDVDRRWVLRVSRQLTVDPDPPAGEDVSASAGAPADGVRSRPVTITGTAAGLYLALWNRGDDVSVSGRPDVLGRWRDTQRVRWS